MAELTVAWFNANKPEDFKVERGPYDTAKFESLLESYEARMKTVEEVLEDPKAAGPRKCKQLVTGLGRITTQMKAEIRHFMQHEDDAFREVLEAYTESIEEMDSSVKSAMKKSR